MAKKKFNISSTLNKNQGAKLADKIPLKKTAKDLEEVKEKVDQIHPDLAGSEPATKPKTIEKAIKPPAKEQKIKLVRMTIDTPEDMHKKLKIKSIEKGISLRDYILRLITKELK